jgi:hypothetical protein
MSCIFFNYKSKNLKKLLIERYNNFFFPIKYYFSLVIIIYFHLQITLKYIVLQFNTLKTITVFESKLIRYCTDICSK